MCNCATPPGWNPGICGPPNCKGSFTTAITPGIPDASDAAELGSPIESRIIDLDFARQAQAQN